MREHTPPEGIVDYGTRIDELIIRQIAQNESMISQNESIKQILSSILASSGTQPGEMPPLIITYPEDGGTKELSAGISRFDFYEGKVNLPTGLREDLSDSLVEHEFTHCHSIAINAELPVTIRIEDGGAFTTNAGIPFVLPNIKFKHISISTTRKTNVAIFASTSPKALYLEPDSFCPGNPFVHQGTVATAGTPNTEEVYAALGKNGRKGSLRHIDKTGILYVKLSCDGITFTDIISLEPGDVLEFDRDDLHTLMVDTDIGGTEYILIIQSGA